MRRCSSLYYILEKKLLVVMEDSIITIFVNTINTGDMNVCIIGANVEVVTGRAGKVMVKGHVDSLPVHVCPKTLQRKVRRLRLIGQIVP